MKRYYLLASLYLSFSFFYITPVQATNAASYNVISEQINKSELDNRQYQVIELSNKMRVLLVSDPNAVKSLGALSLPVGSLQDPNLQQGLAHYTEHMVLMGSKKYPEPASFSLFLNRHAGSYNASTEAFRTSFFFEVENSAFEPALDRLANAIASPNLDPKFADKERNAVNSELTMARSNDGFRIEQVDAETINQQHPSSQFSGGNLETLSDKEGSKLHDALVNFHQHYYSANIMVGVIYSNQSITELAKVAENTFGTIPNKNLIAPSVDKPVMTPDTLGKLIAMIPAQPKKLLYLQFSINNNLAKFADKSDEYIAYLINNRSQNTLFDQLQKQGLIESIRSGANPIRYGNSGVFNITVTLTDAGLQQKDKVIAAVFNYLNLIQTQGVSDDYYQEIKKVLALEFKYQSVDRDMSYVEWLSGQMLFYPTQHILDADYIATHFDKTSILDRLKSLTIDNARIWVIAPDQVTDKTAYFVDAPYKIDNITAQQQETWAKLAASFSFSLPVLNPFLPDDFTIVTQTATAEKIKFSPQGNHIHFASRYFANEPKAKIVVSLRNNKALDDVKSQVTFSLLDYIVGRNLAQLQFQADVAGMTLATSSDDGLMISASGFNQHLSEMVMAILNQYQTVNIDEQNLLLAKSWYLEQLDVADHVNSFKLAIQPANALSSVPYFDRVLKKEAVANITINDLVLYKDRLLTDAVPYMLSLGNISNQQSLQLYQNVKALTEQLSSQKRNNFVPTQDIEITKTQTALITQQAASTDNALLMTYIPTGYDEITGRVLSYTLYKIISPWFYDQLRSNEQLGYAVFALPVYIGSSSGIGFLIQSNQYDPNYLLQRYQDFYPVMLEKLTQLSDDDIEQYKKGVLDELTMPPQTLDEEFARYQSDYLLSNFDFDSKDKKIARVKQITKTALIEFYTQAVIDNQGLLFASQVLGKAANADKELVPVTGYTKFDNAAVLQQQLLQQQLLQ